MNSIEIFDKVKKYRLLKNLYFFYFIYNKLVFENDIINDIINILKNIKLRKKQY